MGVKINIEDKLRLSKALISPKRGCHHKDLCIVHAGVLPTQEQNAKIEDKLWEIK